MPSFPLKYALITGASSGIGAEFALQLHERGFSVCLVARRVELLVSLAERLNSMRPESATILVADLASDDAQAGWPLVVEYIQKNNIDLLVNNAGFGSFGYFEEQGIEREVAMVRLNVESGMRLISAIVPKLKAMNAGAVITISSISAFQALPFMATYAATKVFNLFHSLALTEELREFGVSALAVCPGPTATEFGGVARVPGTITGVFRDPVDLVVRNSLLALDKNRSWIITSWRALIYAALSIVLPRSITTRIVGKKLKSVLLKSKSN